jgi:hypothetical protein
LPRNSVSFDEVRCALKLRSVPPREVADLFFHLKRLGNAAAHEDSGTASEALAALKIARTAAIWFHRSYGGAPDFKPGPFVPPARRWSAATRKMELLLRRWTQAKARNASRKLPRARYCLP